MRTFWTDSKNIILLFLSWRILLFTVAFLAGLVITEFGARFPYYQDLLISTGLPYYVWSFGNFDGVHYINIAKGGYFAQYSQAFFPVYPWLINLFSNGQNFLLTGILLSSICFFVSLFLLNYFYQLQFNQKNAFKSLILFLSFPTAFYFGAVYTESLFLLLVVLVFILTEKRQYLLAGMIGAVASGTRVIGGFLMLYMLIELYLVYRNKQLSIRELLWGIIGIIMVPLGLIFYMWYLYKEFNDPLYFLTAQPVFGASRTVGEIILLPQVIFRYLKILFTVPVFQLNYLNALLELLFTIIPLGLLVIYWKKIKLSYLVFIGCCLVLPTLTGTLSSMPRYSLIIFPLFPLIIQSLKNKYYYLLIGLFVILQIILLSLFSRGYWVA